MAPPTPPPPPPPPPFEPLESFAPLSPAVGALASAANQNSKSGNIEWQQPLLNVRLELNREMRLYIINWRY